MTQEDVLGFDKLATQPTEGDETKTMTDLDAAFPSCNQLDHEFFATETIKLIPALRNAKLKGASSLQVRMHPKSIDRLQTLLEGKVYTCTPVDAETDKRPVKMPGVDIVLH